MDARTRKSTFVFCAIVVQPVVAASYKFFYLDKLTLFIRRNLLRTVCILIHYISHNKFSNHYSWNILSKLYARKITSEMFVKKRINSAL
jgi:hypothetical protein